MWQHFFRATATLAFLFTEQLANPTVCLFVYLSSERERYKREEIGREREREREMTTLFS